MSSISEKYRRPLMTDETGIAIAEKLGGDTTSEYKINTSAEYRKPPISDETAQLILEKIDGGGASNLSDLDDVTLTNPSDGQVLHYDGSEWINATPVNELPAVTSSDNGSVLGVVEGSWNKMEVPTELPSITYNDKGKTIEVNDSKQWVLKYKPCFVVNLKDDGGGRYRADHTLTEAKQAYDSGAVVVYRVSNYSLGIGAGNFDFYPIVGGVSPLDGFTGCAISTVVIDNQLEFVIIQLNFNQSNIGTFTVKKLTVSNL